VRYERQRMRSEAGEQQLRKKRYERQVIRPAASEQQQHETLFDSSSDEEDVQVARSRSTAFLFSVTAEDTRSQAPAGVAEGEREAGSPTALAGNQRRSSAGGELSDPSNAGVSTLSAKGTSSQARGSRAAEKCDNSSEDDNDIHRSGRIDSHTSSRHTACTYRPLPRYQSGRHPCCMERTCFQTRPQYLRA